MQYTTSPVAVKQSICAFLSVSEGIFCIPPGIKDFIQEGYAEEEWPVLILHKGIETLGSRTIQIIKGRCREAEVKSVLVCKFAFQGRTGDGRQAAITRCYSFAISISVFMTSGVIVRRKYNYPPKRTKTAPPRAGAG